MNKTLILALVIVAIIASIVGLERLSNHGGSTQRVELTAPATDANAMHENTSMGEAMNGSMNETASSGSGSADDRERSLRIAGKQLRYPKAVELQGIVGYINSDNFTLQQYVGKKVILIDFWTYSCINCQRTLPYLTSWYEKYKDDGLLIVGVHSPEFDFEKQLSNVQYAVEKYNITYPVVLDNDHATWRAYNNHYWPHEYLIGIDGFIVHDHIGEGGYAETERAIRNALDERAKVLGINESLGSMANVSAPSVDFSSIKTHEIYLGYGYDRGQLGNSEGFSKNRIVNYTLPGSRKDSTFYLGGSWLNNADNMEAESLAVLAINYTAKQVNIVAGADEPTNVSVYVDDEHVNTVTIGPEQLYTLYESKDYGTHDLRVMVRPGVRVYTFTFG